MMVAHCPGHGIMKGSTLDKGCQHNGVVESDVTMDISRGVSRYAVVPVGNHLLLRDGDCSGTYEQRSIEAARHNVDLVICHHVNAYNSPSAHGLIVFYSHDDEMGREVAEMIERAAPYPLIRPGDDDDIAASRGDWTRNANWVMSHYRKHGIPAVLIEWGFATNVNDAKYLLSEKSRPAMAACVLAGVARFFEVKG
jgi:N-acetylmuramoyl-L-alanine amidase